MGGGGGPSDCSMDGKSLALQYLKRKSFRGATCGAKPMKRKLPAQS